MKDKAQSASSVNANQDKYEEKVMLLQLRGVLDYEAVKRAAQNGAIRVREADTETPLVQVFNFNYRSTISSRRQVLTCQRFIFRISLGTPAVWAGVPLGMKD